jgi:transcriptional regulator with XRE-family HTH domain
MLQKITGANMKEEIKVSDVMKAYMGLYGLTQEKFANALNESLINTDVSRVAVTNWCNSKSSPSTDFLLVCAVVYQDWRRTWAVNCLTAKLPEVFESGLVEFKFKLPLVG